MKKKDLKKLVLEALQNHNGKAKIIDVSKYVWSNYKDDLEQSGNMFYTWQYDVRWAATNLRKEGLMKKADNKLNGFWELEHVE